MFFFQYYHVNKHLGKLDFFKGDGGGGWGFGSLKIKIVLIYSTSLVHKEILFLDKEVIKESETTFFKNVH